MAKTKSVKEKLLEEAPARTIDPSKCLSSGLTLLNLASSGTPDWAYAPGNFYGFVGNTSSGKSWEQMQLLAEASINPTFDKYRFYHDNPERGTLMDINRYFGQRVAERLEPPPLQRNSRLLEDFYDQVNLAAEAGEPFIYLLDSEDALIPFAELERQEDDRNARRAAEKSGKDPKLAGSYGMERAKLNSGNLRVAHNALEATGSMLFIIKQTRDRVGFGAQFDPKTKSGGNAITFFATNELWFDVSGSLKRRAESKDRAIGARLRVKVKKNRTSGRTWPVELHFYPDVGFDNTGSNIDFLVEENFWSATKAKGTDRITAVDAPEFFKKPLDPEDLAMEIEEQEGGTKMLAELVTQRWREIEKACAVVRKNPYTS